MYNSSKSIQFYRHKKSQQGVCIFKIEIDFLYDDVWDDFFSIPAHFKKVALFTEEGGIAFYNITPEEQHRIVDYACKNQLCDKKICKKCCSLLEQ